jgi:hypothetical protein
MSSQIKKKFIENNAIDGSKIQLLNGQTLRAVDSSGTDRDLFYFNSSNEWHLSVTPKLSVDPQGSDDLVRKSYVDGQVSTEQTRAQSAESGLQDQIDSLSTGSTNGLETEISRAQAAESSLDSRLGVVEGSNTTAGSVARAQKDAQDYADQKIADLVNSAPGVLDTLKELADAINNDASFAATIATTIANEASRAQGAESAEQSAREAAVSSLQSDLAQEISDRQSAVSSEESARQSADSTIQTALDNEVSARQTAISSEQTARESADSALSGRLDVVEGVGEGSIKKAVADLVASAPAVLDTLKELADALGDDPNFATTVANQIGSEASRAEAAESTLQSNIDAEQSSRQAAVSDLQDQIDVIKGLVNTKEVFTLTSTDVGNGYVELAHDVMAETLLITADRLVIYSGEDYSTSVVSGKTRIAFINTLATGGAEAVEAGDVIRVMYRYQS